MGFFYINGPEVGITRMPFNRSKDTNTLKMKVLRIKEVIVGHSV